MLSVGFEKVIPAIKQLQFFTLNRTAAGIGQPSGCTVLSTLSHKRRDFLKYVIENKMCILTFYPIFVRNISHSQKK